MKKVIFTLLVLTCIFALNLQAQTPQYYNYTTGTTNLSFPLNVAAGKMSQFVVLPQAFATPTPAPAGNITNFYCYINSTYPLGPAQYNTFKIMFLQQADTLLPSGSFVTGAWDTVF